MMPESEMVELSREVATLVHNALRPLARAGWLWARIDELGKESSDNVVLLRPGAIPDIVTVSHLKSAVIAYEALTAALQLGPDNAA